MLWAAEAGSACSRLLEGQSLVMGACDMQCYAAFRMDTLHTHTVTSGRHRRGDWFTQRTSLHNTTAHVNSELYMIWQNKVFSGTDQFATSSSDVLGDDWFFTLHVSKSHIRDIDSTHQMSPTSSVCRLQCSST